MAKTSQIKWRKKDNDLLAQRVRVFNAKRTRLIKQVPELADILPNKVSVKDLKNNIYSRKDFNRTIKSLNRFMKKGAEDTVTTKQGVVTTKYQLNEIKIQTQSINATRRAKRKASGASTEKGTMGSIEKMNLNDKVVNVNEIPKEAWENFINTLSFQTMDTYYKYKNDIYKQNYIKALENELGNYGINIQELVNQLPPDYLVDKFYLEPRLQIDFIYTVEEQEKRAEVILNKWLEIINDDNISIRS